MVTAARSGTRAVLKRLIDVGGAGLLLLLTAPLWLFVALAIKASSRGPVLFRQERVGLDQGRFVCYKFRSMRADSDPDRHRRYIARLMASDTSRASVEGYKLHGDARITPVGRVLRKFSLDELPQLLNVLRGEMSLVGPRPAIPYELEHYTPGMLRRFQVRPGITGLWQVSGRSALGYKEMVAKDLEYVDRWSLGLDLRILLRTPAAVLRTKGTD
jgi:lipopolysaccharide/colanic/teichoic acid biosynthesis glycosyltransferase